jgi:isochorismate hydrolase
MDHYGSGADPVLIKKYATENYRRLKSQLEDQLKQVNAQAREKVGQEEKNENRQLLEDIWK